MKTLAKIIHINDGNPVTVHNGNRLFVETSPREECIVSAFLSEGWTLYSRTFRVEPASNSFYLSGWDYLFTKEVADDVPDNGDQLLNNAIRNSIMLG